MADDSRVEELLEELLDSGGTPEEVCRACPDLLVQVRARWQRLRALQAEIATIFPESTPFEGAGPSTLPTTHLPRIRGYEVQEVLGRGGMGVVYKAWHLRLNRAVALKMLLAGAYARPEELERFMHEAEAVAGLRHANIVQVHDVGDHDGQPYFTMEYVEGGSLAQKLVGAPQPFREAAALVAALAQTVQVAHEGGIVHRDLKPANILLTADGTPKIADFGLARHFDSEPVLTLSGARVGTPSYMAPEQALGKTRALGPSVDVYALGAVLYELLTGRPPFRGETAAETELQVIHQDPVPPSRLNAKVPRDLETICLKCLHKEPQRRYASAAALADDLLRFGEGRPIQARPVGRGERLWRWGRRNPTAAALLATALALVGLVSGGGVWLVQQRARHDAEMRNDAGTAAAQAERLRKGFHFREARELLEQARQRLEQAGPDDLRRQVEQAQADLNLAERLDAARIIALLAGGGDGLAVAEPLYVSALAASGLGREGDDIKAVSARVRDSSLSAELIAALDDWASITTDRRRREWLLAVADDADQNPARNRLRRPELWKDHELWKEPKRLELLIQDINVAEVPPQLAIALDRAANECGGDAAPLLTAVHARYPGDFWLNFALGATLSEAGRWDEAVGYYRAALAVRPDISAAHNNLGRALYAKGRRDEAVGHFEQALRIDSKSVGAHVNLGTALGAKGRLDEAIGHFEEALRIDPKSAGVHFNLGAALGAKGRRDEAIDHLRQAVSINPKFAEAHFNLGTALHAKGRRDEAIDHLRQAVSIKPKFAEAHVNLASFLGGEGRLEEAIDHYQQAFRIDPNSALAQNGLRFSLFDAASAAVRATAVLGSEKDRLGEPERAAKRRQALAWLRADLELTTKLLRDGKLSAHSLATWQTDPVLARVRHPAALAKLPEAEREPWQHFWADVAAVVAADPVEQGRAHAARRDWAQAADCYARGLTRGPTDDGHFWFEYAALLLLSGDRPGYVKACAHLVDRCGKDKGPRSYHVARAWTLAPHAVADMSLPGRLAEKELQASREFWSLTERGALAYRAGRFQEAAPLFEQSLRANPKPGAAVLNWLWLALAHQRLGNAGEARRWLGKAQAWLDQYGDGMPARAEEESGLHFHNWLEAHVLRREAERIILSDLPSSRQGK
jgi:eukaryotic-like serine/threonine-protein kinase